MALTLWGKEAYDMKTKMEEISDEAHLDATQHRRALIAENNKVKDILTDRKKIKEDREQAALNAYDAVRQEANKEAWLARNPGKTPGAHNLKGGGRKTGIAITLLAITFIMALL